MTTIGKWVRWLMLTTFEKFAVAYFVVLIGIGCSKRTVVFPYETMTPTIPLGGKILLESGAYRYGNPKRFEIVTFTPTLEARHANVEWLARVIGMPGETIEIHVGKVLVNSAPLDFPPSLRTVEYQPRSKASIDTRIPTPIKLGAEEFFLLADNPIAVTDSREMGPILLKQIKARVILP